MKKFIKLIILTIIFSCLVSCNQEKTKKEVSYTNSVPQSDYVACIQRLMTHFRYNKNSCYSTDLEMIIESEIITEQKEKFNDFKIIEEKSVVLTSEFIQYDHDNKVLKVDSIIDTTTNSKITNSTSVVDSELVIQEVGIMPYCINLKTEMYEETNSIKNYLNTFLDTMYLNTINAMESISRFNATYYVDNDVPTIVVDVLEGTEEKPTSKSKSVMQIGIDGEKMHAYVYSENIAYRYLEESTIETKITAYSYGEYIEKEMFIEKLDLDDYLKAR